MTQETNNLAAYIWSLADLLRGDFKQSQYGRIILPFTLLRRLECVFADSKAAVLEKVSEVGNMRISAKSVHCFNNVRSSCSVSPGPLDEFDMHDGLDCALI